MADVTISGLAEITATGNSVIPISLNNTTYKTSVTIITPGDGYTYHTFTSTGNNTFIG